MSIFLLAALGLCFLSLMFNVAQMLKGFSNGRQGAITLIHASAILMIILGQLTKTPH